jgi:hypothetical protein
MRISVILLTCAAALCVAAGCSDQKTCAPCAPAVSDVPLAEMNFQMGGNTTAAVSDTLRLDFASTSADTLFDLYVTRADSGTVRTIDAHRYAPFAKAIARLSNGTDEMWYFWTNLLPGGGGGSGTNESVWLTGGYTGGYHPDLQGAEITKIWIYLNVISTARAGGTFSFSVRVKVVFAGEA